MQNQAQRKITETDLPKWAESMAPCLLDGPYKEEARTFIRAAISLENSTYGDLVRMMAAYQMSFFYRWLERESREDPIPLFKDFLLRSATSMQAAELVTPPICFGHASDNPEEDISKTATHYGNLFSQFDVNHYVEEPKTLLRQRLERNGYDTKLFGNWRALDAGCGNGRYTLAMKNLGMKEVVGVDISPINIDNAKQRLEDRKVESVEYIQANVLDIPLADDSFDFVFSNGVLHHTVDCAKGIKELVRLLKPGGCGYFKVMSNPGGIHWDSIEICRILLKDIPLDFCHNMFKLMNVPANLRYLYLDHMLVPINIRYTAAECEEMLKDAGAKNIRRLVRGADVDREERVEAGEPYMFEKYGECANRYYFEK